MYLATVLLLVLLGAFLGACLVIYVIGSKRLKHSREAAEQQKYPTFFLNILLLNKKQVIINEVKKKIGYGLFGVRQRIAGSLAAKVVSATKFTNNVAEKLVEGIPPKLKLQAIESISELCYVKESYAVISVSITNVNSLVLIGKQADGIGKTAFGLGKTSNRLQKLLEWLGALGVRETAEFAMSSELGTLIERKMVEIMGEQIMKKLQISGGVECVCEVKHAHEQPSYFYSFLKEMEKARAELKKSAIGELNAKPAS